MPLSIWGINIQKYHFIRAILIKQQNIEMLFFISLLMATFFEKKKFQMIYHLKKLKFL